MNHFIVNSEANFMNDKGINDKLKSISEGSQKQKKAVTLYASAKPIEGTLAEKYLVEHRHIPKEVLQHTTFKYDEKSKSLVTPIYDSRNILTGVQLIQLNEEGQKAAPGNDAKRVTENRHHMDKFGRVAMIRQGTDLTRIYIAEGVETAASLLSVIPEEFTIVASLGIQELTSSIPYIRASLMPGAQVVWLADNDKGNKEAEKQLLESKEHFIKSGFKIGQDLFIVAPMKEGEDWNDVLCDGSTNLQESFELSQRALETEYSHMDTEYIIETPLTLLDRAPYEDVEEKETIEQSFSDTESVRLHIIKMEEQLCRMEDYKSLVKILEKLNVDLEKLKTRKFEETHSLAQAERDLKKINRMISDIKKVLSISPEKSTHPAPDNHKKKLETKLSERMLEIQLYDQAIGTISKLTDTNSNIENLLVVEPAFAQYFNKFEKEQQINCREGKLQSYQIRQLILEVHKNNLAQLSREINLIKASQLQENSVSFINDVADSCAVLDQLKNIVAGRQKKLEQQNEELCKELEELYLRSLDPKKDFFCNMTLQWWYNNLSAFTFSKPITYTLEPFGHSVELAKVEYLDNEEPEIEETIEQLAHDILQRSGIAKQLNHQESTSEQGISLYERSVKDYAYKLAMNMHRSFSVRIPLTDSRQEQEFDGIAKRRFTKTNPLTEESHSTEEYVILERKTNTGTRQGAMQTAFTQDKINSKMTFFKRGAEYEKFTHTIKNRPVFTDRDIVLCNKEEPGELKLSACHWYRVNSDVLERMDKAAKEILAEALNTRNIEFVFNHPGHNVGKATEKNYFNTNFIQRAMLRVSKCNAGEEDEILKRLENFYRGWMEKCSSTSQTSLVSDEGTAKNSTHERTTDRNYCEFFARNSTKSSAKDTTEPKLNNLHGA